MPEMTEDACRGRAVAALDLVGAPPETEFGALASLVAQLLDCPIGMVTLIDQDTQWVAAVSGPDIHPLPRSEAFCNYTIRSGDVMTVEDATIDPRFMNFPLVTGPTSARAYAGLAISSVDPRTGRLVPVGAVCAFDTHTRDFAPRHHEALTHLQGLAESLFAARALKRQAEIQADHLGRSDRIFRQAERLAKIGSWRLDIETEAMEWSDGVYGIYDISVGVPVSLSIALGCLSARNRVAVVAAIEAAIETGVPFDLEFDFTSVKDARRRVRTVGEIEFSDGRPVAVIGVHQDVTARYALEENLRRSATTDDLTRIGNRAAFNAKLQRSVDEARSAGTSIELVLVDVDMFKQINDRHGHLVGDEVLRCFAERLSLVHATDAYAARIGGDEFALIISSGAAAQAPALIAHLIATLKLPVHTQAGLISVSGTIGHASFDPLEETLDAFIQRADSALYEAKYTERGTARSWVEPSQQCA